MGENLFYISKVGVLLISLALLPSRSIAQSASTGAPPACVDSVHRQFDFWVGQWNVVNAAGNQAGKNTIDLSENGCLLVENWTSAAGNTGKSMNYWDPDAEKWKQVWVSSGGQIGHFSGELVDGAMILEGDMINSDGTSFLLRGTWTTLEDGRVRQHFEQSNDKGATWTTWFDGYYTKE